MNVLNRQIGRWMPVIAPLCLCAGVVFSEELGGLIFLVPFVFAFMTFCGALNSSFRQLLEIARHPLPLIVAFVMLHAVVPLTGLGTGRIFFPGSPYLIAGIVLEFAVPAAVVSFMWSGMSGGDASLTLSILLVDTLLSPVVVPATMHFLVGSNVKIDALGMMRDLLWMIALPAVLSMVLNQCSGGKCGKKLSPVLAPYSKLALIFVITVNSTRVAPFLRNMTPLLFGVTAAMLLLSAFGYVAGWLAGLPLCKGKEKVVSMTFGCGMRNISAGAVIAAAYFPPETMFPVMIATLFQQVLASLFSHLLKKRYFGGEGD